ncbi:hypothetical protein [Actinoplanes sp. NPDC051411]|uniref:hypothetical protein n=1 Tax=Actinoplanes sp. NPDC051411 TaxID=3155522 RepID=UPI00342AAFF4
MTTSSTERKAVDDALDEEVYDRSGFDRPLITMEEFLANGTNVFRSDEEVDDLIAMVRESRRTGLA